MLIFLSLGYNIYTMTNTTLKEARTRGYFLEATKEILKGEGIKALSVRNIAERAGYSYATLYNYFKDQTELISLSLLDFKDECRDAVNQNIRQSNPGKSEIKSIVIGYVNYFVQYPGVFDLFYIEKLASKGVNEEVVSFLDKLCEEDWNYLIGNNTYSEERVIALRMVLNHSVIGLLMSYLKRNTPSEYMEFIKSINLAIDTILD